MRKRALAKAGAFFVRKEKDVNMGAISRMATKCRKCPDREKCDYKNMELCAYIEEPQLMADVRATYTADIAQPMAVKHDYRDIKIAENTTVTIDIEEMKRELKKEFYKACGLGLNYGA